MLERSKPRLRHGCWPYRRPLNFKIYSLLGLFKDFKSIKVYRVIIFWSFNEIWETVTDLELFEYPNQHLYEFWKIAQIFSKTASFWRLIVEEWNFLSTNPFDILKVVGLRRKCTKNHFIKQTWHHFILQGFEKYRKKWYKNFCTFCCPFLASWQIF